MKDDEIFGLDVEEVCSCAGGPSIGGHYPYCPVVGGSGKNARQAVMDDARRLVRSMRPMQKDLVGFELNVEPGEELVHQIQRPRDMRLDRIWILDDPYVRDILVTLRVGPLSDAERPRREFVNIPALRFAQGYDLYWVSRVGEEMPQLVLRNVGCNDVRVYGVFDVTW